MKPSKILKQLYQFLGTEDAKKIEAPLNSQPCYVPKFNNNPYNNSKNNVVMRKLTYKLPDDDRDNKNQDIEAKHEEAHEEYENEEVRLLRKTEIQRQNYQCYSINKWRYTVNEDFVRLVEDKCGVMMELAGYIKTDGDPSVLADVEQHRLVKPDYD